MIGNLPGVTQCQFWCPALTSRAVSDVDILWGSGWKTELTMAIPRQKDWDVPRVCHVAVTYHLPGSGPPALGDEGNVCTLIMQVTQGTREFPLNFRHMWRPLGAEDKAAGVGVWQLSSVFRRSKSVTYLTSSLLTKMLDVLVCSLGRCLWEDPLDQAQCWTWSEPCHHWISTRHSTRKKLNDPWLV